MNDSSKLALSKRQPATVTAIEPLTLWPIGTGIPGSAVEQLGITIGRRSAPVLVRALSVTAYDRPEPNQAATPTILR